MQSIKLTLTSLALLLAACSPAAIANTPIADTALPTDTLIAVATTAPTVTAAQAAPTAASTATETSVANATTALVAAAQPQEPPYENLESPVDLLSSYYNAINRQEYERAYGYWQEPPLDYNTFASGYADTASVQLIVQPPTRIEGAAGSLYAEIPTLLVAQHTDGSVHTFAGCVVTRKTNLQPPDVPEVDVWHLYQAGFEEVANNAAIPTLLAQACLS